MISIVRIGVAIVIVLLALGSPGEAGPKKREPGALVLLIDRSGSMRGAKLDAAKESALAAIDALDANDQIAVIAFDSEASVIVRPQRVTNRRGIGLELSRLQIQGGTNVFPGLLEALRVLRDSKVKAKHVIVITDGDSPSDGVEELVTDMRGSNITVSAIGVEGADRNLLAMIADAGDGRLYMVGDVGVLPKLVVLDLQAAFHWPPAPTAPITFDPWRSRWACVSSRSWAGCAP